MDSHGQWIKDIDEVTGSKMSSGGPKESFPIIADESREVAWLYDMVTEQDIENIHKGIAFTIRSVFIVSFAFPEKIIHALSN